MKEHGIFDRAMTVAITEETVRGVVERIVEAVRPERIYLFGSYARASATEGSDLDLCIVANMGGSHFERSRRIHRLFPRRRFALDVFVYTPGEFERQKDLVNSIGYTVQKEGKLLYERA